MSSTVVEIQVHVPCVDMPSGCSLLLSSVDYLYSTHCAFVTQCSDMWAGLGLCRSFILAHFQGSGLAQAWSGSFLGIFVKIIYFREHVLLVLGKFSPRLSLIGREGHG